MNTYEAKQAARKARYEARSEKATAESSRLYGDAKEMASHIPFGQPILIGHHSEKRDRNYRGKIHSKFERSFKAQDKAKHYAEKAESVGKGGVSSDDPDAIVKLREQLAKCEANQTMMKAANRLLRKGDIQALTELVGEAGATAMQTPDFAGRLGFASYQLTNNNANIKRLKTRIASLERMDSRETTEHTIGDVRIVENAEENRLQMFFPGKPSDEVRTNLKKHGFRWSRHNGCWQRQLTNSAIYAAQYVLNRIGENQ